MATVLYLTWHRSRSSFGLPVILVARHSCSRTSYSGWPAFRWRRRKPRAGPFSRRRTSLTCCRGAQTDIGRYPWYTLPDLSGNLIAVVFVTASCTLFNTTGIEVADSSRSQPGAGIERHRPRQYAVGRIRRLYRLRFGQPLRAQLQQRRHRPAVRADRRRDFDADAGLCSDATRLHAEIRARRPPDLSGRRPASQMDHSVAAAAFHRPNICRCWRSSSSSCNGALSPAS